MAGIDIGNSPRRARAGAMTTDPLDVAPQLDKYVDRSILIVMKKGEATRHRMIEAAADAFERNGYSGAGLTDILETSEAPRGSLYFHFPGGKEALAIAAVEAASTKLAVDLESELRAARTAESGLARVVRLLGQRLEESDFEKGCPITSIVASSSGAPPDVRAAVADAMTVLEARLAGFLESHGRRSSDAARLATVVLAAIEGALLLARVRRSVDPLRRVEKALPALLA